MKEKRYKMIYKKNFNIPVGITLNIKVKEEIIGDNIRIIGYSFFENNINKVKLIINNKKIYLKELIDMKNYKDNKIKINMIISDQLYNRSYMFENYVNLIEFSIQNIIEKELTNFENEEIYFDFYNNSIDEVNNDSNIESYCALYKNIRSDYNCLNTSEITYKIENNVNKEMQ